MSVGILAAQLPNVSSMSFIRLSQQVMIIAKKGKPRTVGEEIGKNLEIEFKGRKENSRKMEVRAREVVEKNKDTV